jgi:O-antigen ligase
LFFLGGKAFEGGATILNRGVRLRDLEDSNTASVRMVDLIMGAMATSPIRPHEPSRPEELVPPSPAQPTSVQRFLLGLCAALAVAAPLCLWLGTRGFAPVVGVAGLLCIPWARPGRDDWRGALILAALVLWAALSLSWSPAPNLALPHDIKALTRFTILHLATELAFATALVTALARIDRAGAVKALGWMSWGFLIVPPLLIEEGLTKARLYQALPALIHQPIRADWLPADLAAGGYIVAVLAWPLGMALFRRGRWPLALALAALAPLSMVAVRGVAPTVALAVSLPVFVLTLRFGRPVAKILGALTAVHILATPLVMLAADRLGLYARVHATLWPSWSDRLRIWGFIAERWAQSPLRGAGLDASRTFPGVVPLHPHNGPLQLWFELGLPGAVLGSLFWLWLWRRIGDSAGRDRLYGATAAATATVFLTISAVSFGLWQEWWLDVGVFAAGLCVLFGRTRERT